MDDVIGRVMTTFQRSPIASRIASAGIALGVGVVFTLAALLVPAEQGHGTHLQLGLGQCTFLQLTGWPCPMCGATTSFTLMAHLRPLAAFWNQPFSSFLFLLSAIALAVSAVEIVDPRGRWGRILRWIEVRETVYAGAFLAFMAVGWAWKAHLMGHL